MSAGFRLFGAETSAFSTKLRSYLRYKGMEHEWIARTVQTEGELQDAARFKTLPVLVTASGHAVHDTTPTIEALESDNPEPEIVPDDPACAFLAVVLEDYADLWLSKAVVQYRWGRKKDQKAAAARALEEYYGEDLPDNRKELEKLSIERMVERMPLVGLDKEMGGVVEKSFKRFVKLLNAHLEKHLYIFGGRPSIADFGIAAQMGQLMMDPTPAKIIEKDGPFIKAWIEFMDAPKPGGPFDPLEDVADTLTPLFAKEVGVTFLPWAAANLEASLARQDVATAMLAKDEVSHKPMKSAARSFRDTRRKYSMVLESEGMEDLLAFLEKTKADSWLRRPEREDSEEDDSGKRGGKRRRGRRGGRKKPASAETKAQETADASSSEASSEPSDKPDAAGDDN